VTITANGWHALFHLLPGLTGIAVASRPRASLAYALGFGALYVVVGAIGLLAGGDSLGPIAVDASGDVVHIAEGAIVLAAGLATAMNSRVVASVAPRS
jgi:NhaP-type Na+/H+ and K+/H+ antiporter